MSRNVIDLQNGVSVLASAVTRISRAVSLDHTWDVDAHVVLSNVSEANAILFKLQDSYDSGATWEDVGSESEAPVTSKAVDSSTGVNATTNVLTSTAHGFITGQPVIYRAHTVAITGLVDATTYYVIKIDADTFKLATTYANSIAASAIDITGTGTGASQKFYPAVYQIRMVRDDASDLAQLPLGDLVRVVAVTAASDTCTVSKVYFKERW